MLGSQQVRPVIGAVEAGSLAEVAGLQAGQEIVAINGQPTSGWAAVNLQLVRRLGESGRLILRCASRARRPTVRGRSSWITGCAALMSRIRLRRWVFARGVRRLQPVLAQLDPEGPGAAAGLQVGDRLLALDGQPLEDWQQLVDQVRDLPGKTITAAGRARKVSSWTCRDPGRAR